MIYKKLEAIQSLRPKAEFVIRGDVIEWLDKVQTQPSDSAINAEITRLQTEYNNNKYQRDRALAYDPVKEQLDQLYWDKKNGTNKWVEAIDKVKSDNPKP
tara:strand:- start:1715 stop:2014 length:300 start_codon:yes stop_codon:yes gene_type:complete